MKRKNENKSSGKSILILIFFASLVRILFFLHAPRPVVLPDSLGYFDLGKQILETKNPVHYSRPPVYPLFLSILTELTGDWTAPIYSDQFYRNFTTVVLIQSIMGIGSVIIVYWLFLELKVREKTTFFLSLLYSGNILIIASEKSILTESFALFLLLVITYFSIQVVKTRRLKDLIILYFIFLLAIFLKPVYLSLPIILLFITNLHLRQKKILLGSILLLIALIVPVLIYIKGNIFYHKYPGFSRISDFALLGQILYYNIPIDQAKGSGYLYDQMTDYRKLKKDPSPFKFLEYYDPQIYSKPEKQNEITAFNRQVILGNLPLYLFRTLKNLPSGILVNNYILSYYQTSNNQLLIVLFKALLIVSSLIQYLYLISIPGILFIGTYFLFHLSLPIVIPTLIGMIAGYQLIVTALGYFEFGRLLVPILPQLFIFSCFCWMVVFGYIKNKLKSFSLFHR